MEPHSRKLLQDQTTARTFFLPPDTSSSSTRPSSSPFNSSTGLTALSLLSALFFLGFFSIYLRRCARDHHHRRRRRSSPSYTSSWLTTTSKKGLDPSTVGSLPLVTYGGDPKHPIDCVICLSEFSEGESVKLIPNCRHVFHPECVDRWLATHVSCPLCRSTRLFSSEEAEEVKLRVTGTAEAESDGGRPTVGDGDTREDEVGTVEMRRCCSCRFLGLGDEVARLQRSSSV